MFYLISQQIFTVKSITISHLKGYKMGFSEKIYLSLEAHNIPEKNSEKHKLS